MADCKHTHGIINLLIQARPYQDKKGYSIVPNWCLAMVADSIKKPSEKNDER